MLFDWSLIMFGTATDPLKGNRHVSIPLKTPITMPTSTQEQKSDTQTTGKGKAILFL